MQPQAHADRALHSAATDTPAAHQQPRSTRRPLVPMTATEALAVTGIEIGLLLLIASWEGLLLIAVGIIGYLYGRLTYKPALWSLSGHPTLLGTLTETRSRK